MNVSIYVCTVCVCMYAFMHALMYMFICIYACAHVFIYFYASTCLCISHLTWSNLEVCMHVCKVYIYVCMYSCMNVQICLYLLICLCTLLQLEFVVWKFLTGCFCFHKFILIAVKRWVRWELQLLFSESTISVRLWYVHTRTYHLIRPHIHNLDTYTQIHTQISQIYTVLKPNLFSHFPLTMHWFRSMWNRRVRWSRCRWKMWMWIPYSTRPKGKSSRATSAPYCKVLPS